ncbi:ANTAR domain-containing response regulator [Streptomyces sp. NPDC057877]|uniref:ANTAR domain-containing response regulator n=1 Tax=Streptomyces sp. NPDC057877 TaxID=3346269 RepID=UPI00368E9F0E
MDDTTRELRLAAALLESVDTLTEGFDPGRQLRGVADRCAEALGARAAGVLLVDGERVVSLAASGGLALELLAAQRDDGPGLDAYRSGRAVAPVALGSARAASRWPGFTRAALRYGVGAALAVPLRGRERRLGALNVFLAAPPEGDAELRLAQALADGAALGLHHGELYRECRARAGQLERALSSRVRIEQAKGMLAERWNTGPDDAFTALRQYARRHRLPLDQVARSVVERTADDAGLRREAEGPAGPG